MGYYGCVFEGEFNSRGGRGAFGFFFEVVCNSSFIIVFLFRNWWLDFFIDICLVVFEVVEINKEGCVGTGILWIFCRKCNWIFFVGLGR